MTVALGVVGLAMSAIGSMQAASSQSAAAQANANVLRMQADQATAAAEVDVQKLERQKRQALSTQKALYAKSGVLISEGSPVEVMSDTATQYQLDINQTRYNAAVEAGKYKYQAGAQDVLAKDYQTAGYINAGSTLLTGGYNVMKSLPIK